MPHLHIESLSSTGVVKGAGTAMMQEAVKQSIKLGYEGRIVLNAGAYGKNVTRSPLPFILKWECDVVVKIMIKFSDNCQ